ncbi:MAG: bifunctional 5,10-methylenetetrahydrofolate dehydrogenase/5,10-methenyltetrahydrofolate cyclohydrolase [Ilumatobacteraceae bacterium]|jgi:methylenetetrahydrofolate dehydrogenase (NADP+)/methenyltetrahydrofolate cyclohydrolase|nr:bifunctional 5,10-methylenetetrahydrofolate dehydrogenase/5,10-methenyltetrahydrofolate cyclohydrolase [Ilumatobacteraceae bacterium]MBJ7422001.1 bifunctional 5,10-methylenetetrahydrofolate dehydrogenase/5,10-methenyltetrahydrofolate cyclohydrolase [Ilumatobacteraceae bacterium]
MSSEVKRTAGGALLLDGMQLRDETVAKIKATIAAAGNPKICLATVLIGDDPPSHIYVANKHKKAQEAGMVSKGLQLPADATQAQVEKAVSELVADKTVHGILVQLPLPKHINTEAVLALLPVEKDVDGLTERSLGRLVRDLPGHVPCTPLGVVRILQRYKIETVGKRVVVIGRSALVGLPQMLLLVRRGADATVTVAHKSTKDMIEVCRESDIIIAAAGAARMVTAAHVKPGATVIDVGVTRINNKIVGDVDFDAVQAIAGAITPMPGGTGPMTIACLLENTLEAARMQGAI